MFTNNHSVPVPQHQVNPKINPGVNNSMHLYPIGNPMFNQFQPIPYVSQPPFNYPQYMHQPYFQPQSQYQSEVEVENIKVLKLEENVEELKIKLDSFIKTSEIEKENLKKTISIQAYKINQLIDIVNSLINTFKKDEIVQAIVVQPTVNASLPVVQPTVNASLPVVDQSLPVENSLKRKRQPDVEDVENGIKSDSWIVNVEPAASYNKRAMLSSEELIKIQKEIKIDSDDDPIIISSTEITEEEVADIDDLTKEEISKMVDNAINSYLSQQIPVDENKYFIDFNDKNIKLLQNKTNSKSTEHEIIEVSVISSNSLSSIGNEEKTVKYILIRQVFKPLINSEANLNSTILRAKLTYGIEYLKTHIKGYHNNRLIMNYTGLFKMLEYIKEKKPSLLNNQYGQSLFKLVEELK
jgi:hypothetical protein